MKNQIKKKKLIDIILLCGGKGKRLKKISKGSAKSLVIIKKNLTVLDLILQKIRKNRFRKIYISINLKKKKNFLNFKKKRKEIFKIITEKKYMGTGGAIKHAIKKKNISDPFMVINGDTLSKATSNLNIFFKSVRQEKKSVVGISKNKSNKRFGIVKFSRNKVNSFQEKKGTGSWINNGHYLFFKDNFKIVKSKIFSLENDLLPRLVEKKKLNCVKFENDTFQDIGTVSSFNKLKNKF